MTGKRIGIGAVAAALAFAATGQGASAQVIFDGGKYRNSSDPLFDDRAVGVQDRAQPDYDTTPVPIGPFAASPSVETTLAYDSNLLALDTGVVDDALVKVAPELALKADGRVADLAVTVFGNIARHFDYSTENYEEYGVIVDSDFEVANDVSLTASAQAGHFIEDRTAAYTPSNSLSPIGYDRFGATVGIQQASGRIVGRVSMTVDKLEYDNGIDRTSGLTLNEQTRNRTLYSPKVELEYTLTPDTAFFVTGSYNKREFEFTPTGLVTRDSDGFQIGGGVRFKPSPLIELAVGAAYIKQNYTLPLRDVSGLAAEARLRWFPTQLTTVTAGFLRDIDEGGTIAPGSTFLNRAEFVIDHELLRNLILSGEVGWERIEYNFADRNDTRTSIGASAKYRLTRNLGLNLSYRYLDQSSSGTVPGREFDQSLGMISLVLKI